MSGTRNLFQGLCLRSAYKEMIKLGIYRICDLLQTDRGLSAHHKNKDPHVVSNCGGGRGSAVVKVLRYKS